MPPHHVGSFTDTLVSNLLLVQEKTYLALPSDKLGNSASENLFPEEILFHHAGSRDIRSLGILRSSGHR